MTAPVALVSVDDHLALIMGTVSPLEALELQLAEAHGSLLAEDVSAGVALPPYDHASLDGYAVLAGDVATATKDTPVSLHVVAELTPGSVRAVTLQPGHAVRVATGSPVPAGTETVVPLEWTDAGKTSVVVSRATPLGAFLRRAGDDVPAGTPVLPAGTHLGAAQVGLLAALGYQRARVHPRPRVVVISVGAELTEAGDPLPEAHFYDGNSHALAAACREAGAVAYRVGVVRDSIDTLTEVLEDHLIQADAVVLSGSFRVGGYDVLTEVLGRLGTVSVRRVAMEPGLGHGFGTIGPDSTPAFMLPGNPVAAQVAFEVFVRPALRRMLGAKTWRRPQVPAVLSAPIQSPRGRRQFVRARVTHDGTTYRAEPLAGGAPLLTAMAVANALLVVPEEHSHLEAGASIEALLLDRRST